MKKTETEKCCGTCVHFLYECTDGDGYCESKKKTCYCYQGFGCDNWQDEEVVRRHYAAVLIQANRYRRDRNVPSIYRMPNPTELGKAIDYAVRCMTGRI